MRVPVWAVIAVSLLTTLPALAASATEEALWQAAQGGDLARVMQLHQEGVDINARTRYGATALSYACDKGQLEIARYLVENGAEVNTQDDFYQVSPLGWALFNEHADIVVLLLEHGATGAEQVLTTGVRQNDPELVAAALASSEINQGHVNAALTQAKTNAEATEIVALLEKAEVAPAPEVAEAQVDPATLESYVGNYKNAEVGLDIAVTYADGQLTAQATGQPPLRLRALSETEFEATDSPQIKVSFGGRGGMVEQLVVEQGGQTFAFPRVTETADAEAGAAAGTAAAAADDDANEDATKPAETTTAPVERKAAINWPAFRGMRASGVGDGQGAPTQWDVASGKNVRWKTPIPGMANSSPIVWGDRVFVTTAVSGAGDDTFRTGLYGDVDMVDDISPHEFKVYALDKKTGEVLWQHTAARAIPGARRHLKSTQANSTPVTDGKHVVALFGTVGVLATYDVKGKLKWKKDIGVLNAGWFYDESYEWGHASSPIIYKGLVIVQADVRKNSFIAAWRLKDGKEMWRTPREDVPSWGSPTIYEGKRDELITNGQVIRGYDPATGEELWTLGPNSEVTVATPIIAHGLFYVTAGYPPVRPIYAIRPGSKGDLTLPEATETSEAIAWSKSRGGTYMPTPIVYGDYLYTCANNGRLSCYKASTGEQVYRARIGDGGSFTASPVAADGRLYFTTETGDVFVVKAGPQYEELARNEMGEICMSTPAISDGFMFLRTLDHVYALGQETATE